MYKNEKGFSGIEILLVLLVASLIISASWLVLRSKKDNSAEKRNTGNSQNNNPSYTPTTYQESKDKESVYTDQNTGITTVKGMLLIYDSEDPALTLEGQVFEPNVWYVNPRDVKWPGTKETNYKLDLTTATCSYPDTPDTDKCDNSKVKWMYGDRVTIEGTLKENRMLAVKKMVVVSSENVENW